MAATKSKTPKTLDQLERQELAQATKNYKSERYLIKEKFNMKRLLGNVHILAFYSLGRLCFCIQNDSYFTTYKETISPTKDMVKKLLKKFPPINAYYCREKGNKAFYYEGNKKITEKPVELIYPILIKTKQDNGNLSIEWETENKIQISIQFSKYKTSFIKLLEKPSSDHGMEAINYQGGYSTMFWPYQSEFDITEYIQ